MTNYSMAGRTYRYFEGDPLYPFGYGLSYTTFKYDALEHTAFVPAGQPLKATVSFQNVGEWDADEVVCQIGSNLRQPNLMSFNLSFGSLI